MDRRFKFKLLVPPRANTGHVNAVRPQETENSVQQGSNSSHDKVLAVPFVNKSVVAPSKPARQDFLKMTALSPLEKEVSNRNPGELYSQLFDEVEKIKCWKVKADADTAQKERKLQDNLKTIETQRQAIQELQFGNESLSIKLEEQMSENENLMNKNNTTVNLCNILKETFQWSSEKMNSFESEREETHQLFMENSENIKKLTAEFDGLRNRMEAEKQETQKVKRRLLEFEVLKEKYQQEHKMKKEEIAKLQTKLQEKKDELHKALFDLSESQTNRKQLQDLTSQQLELVQSLKAEKESLLQKLNITKQHCTKTEKILETTAAALEQSKRECEEMIQSKDLSIQELSRAKIQLTEKLEMTEAALQELKTSHSLEKKSTKDLKDKLMTNCDELEKRTKLLEEIKKQMTKQSDQIKILEDELDTRSKTVESFKSQIDVFEVQVKELVAELSLKTEEAEMLETKMQELEGQFSAETKRNKECTSEVERLQKHIFQHEVSYEKLLTNFGKLQSEKTSCQQEFERETQRLEEENQCLRNELNNMKTRIQGICEEAENVQRKNEEKCGDLQEKIAEKEKQIKAVEGKLCNLRKKFEDKFQVQEDYKKENKLLKKQITKETTKSRNLEKMIDKLQEESQNFKKLKEQDCEKLIREIDSKSTSTAELENEVQRLKLVAAEAEKNREDTELKCQLKIADMVALMEKHKSQYDRIVEEKDAELTQNKNKEMEAVSHAKSLEVDLSKQKTENEQLMKQLKTEATEKVTLQEEVAKLKKEIAAAKIKQSSEVRNKQSPVSNYKLGKDPGTPEKSSLKNYKFDFKIKKTPNSSNVGSTSDFKKAMSATNLTATPNKLTQKKKPILSGDIKTLEGDTSKINGTSKIKSYRIKTPPYAEKAAHWGKGVFELDSSDKSDSSVNIDHLTFSETPAPTLSVPKCRINLLKKMQSPVTLHSPGNSSKMAAMKRMRDAGWTAVTGCDKKKKKKTNEKIFA